MEPVKEIQASKPYRKPLPIFWWMTRWVHIKFITRELTSVFVAAYVVVLLLQIRAALKGPEAYNSFVEILKSPVVLGFHFLALAALIFHSVTWFNLAPKAMVIKIGDKKIPGVLIALLNYGGWVMVSLLIGWLLTGAT